MSCLYRAFHAADGLRDADVPTRLSADTLERGVRYADGIFQHSPPGADVTAMMQSDGWHAGVDFRLSRAIDDGRCLRFAAASMILSPARRRAFHVTG